MAPSHKPIAASTPNATTAQMAPTLLFRASMHSPEFPDGGATARNRDLVVVDRNQVSGDCAAFSTPQVGGYALGKLRESVPVCSRVNLRLDASQTRAAISPTCSWTTFPCCARLSLKTVLAKNMRRFAIALRRAPSPHRRAEAQDDATCRGYGVAPGSRPYVACRMNLANNRTARDIAHPC
jgi:hypothetical protein